MENFSFVFTVFFMLLGPIKVIPAFYGVTRNSDSQFKRAVAIRAGVIASASVAFVALAGVSFLTKYHISVDAVRIGGGLVLLIAALNTIFPRPQPASANSSTTPTALQLAVSPVAMPIIVPTAGVAAILIFSALAPENPGMNMAVGICLAIVMVLDFLVMHFIDTIMKTPGLMYVLQILGGILVFMQVGLAIETIVTALKNLKVLS